MRRIAGIIVFLTILMSSHQTSAQFLESVLDFLTVYPNQKAVQRDSTLYPAKIIFTPILSYAPETNWAAGVGTKCLFKVKGSGAETRTSNIPLSIQYTLDNKYLFYSGFAVFSPQERYMYTGNVLFQSFPSLYYGVGPKTNKSNEERFAYSQILLEPIFLKNILRKYLFVGGGLRYFRVSNVEAVPDGLLDNSTQTGAAGSRSSGLELAFIYDSRDNILNAYSGMYLLFTHGYYDKLFGSQHRYQLTKLDVRYYLQPLKKPSSILALQFMTRLSHGDTPLLDMGRLGGDGTLRGYFEGRYTDKHLVMTQVEWRQRLSSRWGMVIFAGAGSVAGAVQDFAVSPIRGSVGLGLRFMVDTDEKLNLRLDYAIGNEKSNYYFKIAESF